MKKFRLAATAFAVSCAISVGVKAQQVGTYQGKTADGEPVSFTVTQNSKGQLALTAATIYFSAKCKSPNGDLNSGVGVGMDQVIKNSKASWTFKTSDTVWFMANFTFVIDQVSGDITTRAAAFVPGKQPPAAAEFCESPKQAFSATFVAPEQESAPSAGVEVHYPSPQ
jgi:hypothetical protein